MRIFLDSGDPAETKEALKLLGSLDGQTTNPSLIAKNPATLGKKFSQSEILAFYKNIVQNVSKLIPHGSVSIEVYADQNTTAEEMLKQGREFFTWIPNAHIKFPITSAGLAAAEGAIQVGMRVNMTLCFSQEQAAAVYAATMGAKKGDVFISPFIGRLDDRGERGTDLIANIMKMYAQGDGHVEVLAASIRNLAHIKVVQDLGVDIITAPLKALRELPQAKALEHQENNLRPIPYQEISLNRPWQEYHIKHELTDVGLEKFCADWNSLLTN